MWGVSLEAAPSCPDLVPGCLLGPFLTVLRTLFPTSGSILPFSTALVWWHLVLPLQSVPQICWHLSPEPCAQLPLQEGSGGHASAASGSYFSGSQCGLLLSCLTPLRPDLLGLAEVALDDSSFPTPYALFRNSWGGLLCSSFFLSLTNKF